MKIVKCDKVKVLYGSQRGKQGLVEKVIATKKELVISGVGTVKKHVKGKGIIEVVRGLAMSKVMLVCPKCLKATRVKMLINEGRKVRLCCQCGSNL